MGTVLLGSLDPMGTVLLGSLEPDGGPFQPLLLSAPESRPTLDFPESKAILSAQEIKCTRPIFRNPLS